MALKAITRLVNVSRTVLADRALSVGHERTIERIENILKKLSRPDYLSSEEDFESLRRSYHGVKEYGYDSRSVFFRATTRAKQILDAVPSIREGDSCLEIGCGDGMTSAILKMFGLSVSLTDLVDWREHRAKSLPFQACDLGTESELPGGPYDLIFSYNAFEHFPDPASVISRMLGKLRPGGHLFFEFGPLYAGPWGLHAYRMLPMPYPQYLFSEPFWKSKLAQSGVQDLGQELEGLQPLNQWTVDQFDALWRSSGCEVIRNERYLIQDHLDVVLRYPQAFQGRGLTVDDLITQGVCVLLRKPAV